MPPKNRDEDEKVSLIRLPKGRSPQDIEQAIRNIAPEFVGSLLTWLHDDWYAVAPDVTLFSATSTGSPLTHLESAGAAGFQEVDVATYGKIVAMRDVQGGESSASLRDRDLPRGVFVDPPTYWWPGQYMGRTVKLDWHLAAVGIPDAWEQLGPSGPAAYASVIVGHIDTGYSEHPALGWGAPGGTWLRTNLGKNYWKDRVDPLAYSEGYDRWNIEPEYPGPRDNLSGPFGGHGTRTSGVLCGLYAPDDQSLEYPFFGSAPGVPVIPYRITNSVLIDHVPDLLAKAIRDAISLGAQVISISLGAARRSKAVAKAVNDAYQAGVIVCAAAGNVVRPVIYPGRFNCVITVGGATTPDGRKFFPWRGASRGDSVDVSGPADQIRRPSTVKSKGKERFIISGPGDGTSFATALCAGVAALWLAKRSTELDASYGPQRWARVAAFKQLIMSTAFVPTNWPTSEYGTGVFDAGALLKAALPPLNSLEQETDI